MSLTRLIPFLPNQEVSVAPCRRATRGLAPVRCFLLLVTCHSSLVTRHFSLTFSHLPDFAERSTASSTAWFFTPSRKLGEGIVSFSSAVRKSATAWTKVCS